MPDDIAIKDPVNQNKARVRGLTNTQSVDVSIVDGSGDQVTSFGGGTQYADGAVRGTATGTLMMVDDGTNIQSAAGTSTGLVKVDLSATAANLTAVKVDGSAVTQPISGTVTANAGTNLNTSTLALESGGNLATIAGKDFATQTTLAAINTKLTSGTDIGDVTINNASGASAVNIQDGGNTITVDGTVTVGTQPARDRLTDNIGVALQTDAMLSDTTSLTPKFAVINASTSGDNTLVAAVASKKIRVVALSIVVADALTIRFESGASGTALTGQMQLAANGGLVLPFNPVGWFETAVNTLLNLELSGATNASGCLTYVEV